MGHCFCFAVEDAEKPRLAEIALPGPRPTVSVPGHDTAQFSRHKALAYYYPVVICCLTADKP
jgi:hypothetical protein